jgi:hypothetical protein
VDVAFWSSSDGPHATNKIVSDKVIASNDKRSFIDPTPCVMLPDEMMVQPCAPALGTTEMIAKTGKIGQVATKNQGGFSTTLTDQYRAHAGPRSSDLHHYTCGRLHNLGQRKVVYPASLDHFQFEQLDGVVAGYGNYHGHVRSQTFSDSTVVFVRNQDLANLNHRSHYCSQ